MPRFGKCKTCWWWNQVGENKGICWMQTHYGDNPNYSRGDSYCPDHNPRRDANKRSGTFKQWLEEGGHKYITYKNYIKIMTLWIARDLSNKISLFSDKPKLQFINNYDTQIWVGDVVADGVMRFITSDIEFIDALCTICRKLKEEKVI